MIIDHNKAKKIYTATAKQLYRLRIYNTLSQSAIAGLLIMLSVQYKWQTLFDIDMAFVIWAIIIILIIIRNWYFFHEKDMYTIYLFEDKVVACYHFNCFTIGFQKTRELPFDDLKEFRFYEVPSNGYLFSSYEYVFSFKLIKGEDFTFTTIFAPNLESICQEIKAQWEAYKKEHNIPEYDVFKTDLHLPSYLNKK